MNRRCGWFAPAEEGTGDGRSSRGRDRHPRVAHLVYLAAFMPAADDELASFLPHNATPEFLAGAVFRDDGLVELKSELVAELVCQQAPPAVIEWAKAGFDPWRWAGAGSPR